MPNWCENELVMIGKDKDINLFLNYIKSDESDFDFSKVKPVPEGLTDSEVRDFRLSNWGTKWIPDDVEVETGGNFPYVAFLTAWSPSTPITLWLSLNPKFKNIAFIHMYAEPGMDFSGYAFIKAGKIYAYKSGRYEECVWFELPDGEAPISSEDLADEFLSMLKNEIEMRNND